MKLAITYYHLFDAGGQPIQVFINLPLSEISDIDDQHSVSTELLKFYSVKGACISRAFCFK